MEILFFHGGDDCVYVAVFAFVVCGAEEEESLIGRRETAFISRKEAKIRKVAKREDLH